MERIVSRDPVVVVGYLSGKRLAAKVVFVGQSRIQALFVYDRRVRHARLISVLCFLPNLPLAIVFGWLWWRRRSRPAAAGRIPD